MLSLYGYVFYERHPGTYVKVFGKNVRAEFVDVSLIVDGILIVGFLYYRVDSIRPKDSLESKMDELKASSANEEDFGRRCIEVFYRHHQVCLFHL